MSDIYKVAIIGCGSIGASWAALFAAQGLAVAAFDINPSAETFLRNLVDDALPVLSSLGLVKRPGVAATDIFFTTDMQEALAGADFVQENGPEKLEFKQKLFNDIAALVSPETIIATSSSGLTCSSIQDGMQPASLPERCVVGHPFNPPHLIPLVEVVGGSHTSQETVDRSMKFYEAMGKKPVHVKKEVVGHVANRLQAALMREVLYLLQKDVANVSDIDNAMSYGPGLRWGVMGPSLLLHLGGGEGGVQHMANHLLGPLMTWYAPKDPDVTDELKGKWVDGTLQGVAGREYRQLAKQRDEELVRLLNIRNEWDGYAEARHQGEHGGSSNL
ncbi:3-hydroxyacyl-dehydrogenase [Colletotrichum sojae]|uniref:3-hydroxyacyl-dehydrogenase n=1 Tax=Colletotrichum sojae TaxID=2175907 RepID=A0A8H6MIX5_9PEZI|nr:3-hydroxyacyl-dehydrogenase [Colletotrichum sojae]